MVGALARAVLWLGEGISEGVLGLVPHRAEPGPDRGALADQPVEALEAGLVAVVVQGGEQGLGDDVERRLPGGAVPDRRDERVEDVRVVAEDQLLLGPDVREKRLHRDVGRVRDLRDGHVLEAPLAEKPRGCGEDRRAGQALLPVAQPFARRRLGLLHDPTVTGN